MSTTELLRPATAVRMVWAMTGKFAKEGSSIGIASDADKVLKEIEDRANSDGAGPEERHYVTAAVSSMRSGLRSLDVAYKVRNLKFDENEKLRLACLDAVKESLSFGTKLEDVGKSLPHMVLGGAAGVTLAEAFQLSGPYLYSLCFLLAALGYVSNKLFFVKRARRQTNMLYVRHAYDRGLYYEQYLDRAAIILADLFSELERIHVRYFGSGCETISGPELAESIVGGIRSKFCPHVHDHMLQEKIKPEFWALCEAANPETTRKCPNYKDNDGRPFDKSDKVEVPL